MSLVQFNESRWETRMINLTNFYWAKNVSSYFEGLYKNKEDCDVYLWGDDKVLISAHKIVLKVGSSFFREIISQTHSFATVPVFYVRGADKTSLLKLLEFLYTGQTKVEQNKLEEFMKISNDFSINGLSQSEEKDLQKEKNEQIYSNLTLGAEGSDQYMNMTGLSNDDDKEHDATHHYASLEDIYTNPQPGSEAETPKCLSDDGIKISCPLCEKTFRSKQSFKVHRYRFHTKEKLLQQSLIAIT